MPRFSIITIHPQFVASYFKFGVIRAAHDKNLATIEAVNLRDFAVDKHGTIDDHPYGGTDSMVFRPEPLADAVRSLQKNNVNNQQKPYVLLTSPSGKIWNQDDAQRLSKLDRSIAIVCGRFGGIDERFVRRYVDEEFSIGDFILTGGELPALMMVDSILRLIPGVLGNSNSPIFDSFSQGLGGLVEHPLYTRPPVFEGEEVPPVLLSGDHKKIEEWRQKEGLEKTKKTRPDLLEKINSKK